MKSRLNALIYNKCRNLFIQEARSYAGHSKWQNIKVVKQQQDAARSHVFKSLSAKMKVAVAETGTADPNFNPKLAGLIDQAKKANMPASTLNAILERLNNSGVQGETHLVSLRGTSGAILVLYLNTDNPAGVKLDINHIIKKFNVKTADTTALNMFECASYIAASKDCNLDQAMEDAIQVDATDVEEVNDGDKTYFQFKGEFLFPEKVSTRLSNLGYSILSMDNICTPTALVELGEKEFESMQKLKERLMQEIREIQKIEDNIAS